MPYVVDFHDPGAAERSLTGGKGANLAALTRAGLRVPPGFCVTTESYARFISEGGLRDRIMDLVGRIDYADAASVEDRSAEIRELIEAAAVPQDVADAVAESYRSLGGDVRVAVRSSGTAEDLGDASFAGLHDTYLDIRGADAVVDATKRCWASMWTGRAVAYRRRNDYDHADASICVVVQVMVQSTASGVMFTGNPLTTATDEIVINASWGLGEAVVAGIVTPDQFVVKAPTLKILERTLGDKQIRIIRDPDDGQGTVTQDVPAAQRAAYSLTDDEIVKLADLGRTIEDHYEGFPQDVEWAIAGGTLYVLQSRPITGVDFTWDVDVETPNMLDDDDDYTWTRSWSDAVFTGVVTPLSYSVRGIPWSDSSIRKMMQVLGHRDLEMRAFKYWKGTMYYNADLERAWVERSAPPAIRKLCMEFVPPAWREKVMEAGFSPVNYLRSLTRLHLLEPRLTYLGGRRNVFKTHQQDWLRRDGLRGLTPDELTAYDDDALVHYIRKMIRIEIDWADDVWPWAFWGFRDQMGSLYWMIENWCGGEVTTTFSSLISGSAKTTATQLQNQALWELAEAIRQSPELKDIFRANPGRGFFDACRNSEVGGPFLDRYEKFLHDFGHRGQADRDMFYPRRCEDPQLDYEALRLLLSSDNLVDPEKQDRLVEEKREATLEAVLTEVRKGVLGGLKAEAVKFTYHRIHDGIMLRDNERAYPTDMLTRSYKFGFAEIGRRLHGRGELESADDYHYMSIDELFDLLAGRVKHRRLLQTKIRARRDITSRVHQRESQPPEFLHRHRSIDLSASAGETVEGTFQGAPTSGGCVTGTARVVRNLTEIGVVKPGEILVVNATDPGWTPVFLIIKGIVIETGGMLSHASCLAREYALPAVQLPRAMKLIPDGATVMVNGDAGTVTLVEDVTLVEELAHAAP